jgi:hypothetical protein
MNLQSVDELRRFHRFLGDKLKNEGIDLSPEEALDEWRQQHPESQSFEDEVGAIQEALDDVARGDSGMSIEEFDREFRKQHDLPANP